MMDAVGNGKKGGCVIFVSGGMDAWMLEEEKRPP